MTIGTGESVPTPLIEELVFLARSPHRIQLLTHVSSQEQTHRELQDATGISQPTLGRILGDFERRQWVSNHHNGAYTLTPLGELLVDSVTDLLDALETIDHLTGLENHMPWDHLEFDPRALVDAAITTPSETEPLAHMRRFDELAATASSVKVFSNVLACAPTHDGTETDQEFLRHIDELIVTASALPTETGAPALSDWLGDRIEAGELTLYRYDGPAVFLFGLFDEIAGIVPIDDTGMPNGLLEAETDPIRQWVHATYKSYRYRSTPLRPEAVAN